MPARQMLPLTVILNDNGMSIAPSVGPPWTAYLKTLRPIAKILTADEIRGGLRPQLAPGRAGRPKSRCPRPNATWFRAIRIYLHPVRIDGHNVRDLVAVLPGRAR